MSDNERLHLSSELDEVDLEEMENMWKKTCGEDKVMKMSVKSKMIYAKKYTFANALLDISI